ncbi:hypothetical protein LX99_00104 [Mucilaginibacter oryzae]|uniref:Uncharacterized protein n=1 Tax=Mucilaginibacter oryzae TaxID=468058 RepID=A0A316HGL6_9SPHI|nr:hypothetical protein [Mucilaginibacter oryzae]PWK79646.1 hypothetical protein LX99_00104 [Mucilaginibacter oryzae]
MKRSFLITLLIFCGTRIFAQSVTINDLANVANLSNAEAHNYLTAGKKFKRQYLQEVDGHTIEHLNKIGEDNKEETIVIGMGDRLPNGGILRTVTYTTVTSQHILNLIAQAKHLGLIMKLHGSDAKNDIFFFDNDFFHIVIFLNHDNISGSVEVHQKEYLGLD